MMSIPLDESVVATVGLAFSGGLPLSAPDALALLEAAHTAGLSPLLITEVSGLSATDLAAAFAARNPGVTIGTGIVPLGSRSTAAIAMAARTVAQVSGAPFLLGVGVSTPQIIGDWHQADYDATVDHTADRLADLRALLQGQRHGSFAMPADAGENVKVLLGALGPRMVELGLMEADGVMLNHTPPDAVPDDVPESATVLAYVWVYACDDAGRRARRDLVSYAMAKPYARHFTRLGFGDAVEDIRSLHSAGRLREAPDRLPADLVDALFVTLDGVPGRVAEFHEAGATPVVLPVTGDDPVTEIRALISQIR